MTKTRERSLAEAPIRLYRALLHVFEKYYWIFFALAVCTLAFFCFRCLDVQYVDSWDEARHGVNAYEMIQNGDYIRHTYNYQTDDWNLKPSVSYWGIVLGFRLFGYSVLGLRFASALAYLLTGAVCALFAKRYSKEASILVLAFFCANERPLMNGRCLPTWPGPEMRILSSFCFSPWRCSACSAYGRTISGCISAVFSFPWLF